MSEASSDGVPANFKYGNVSVELSVGLFETVDQVLERLNASVNFRNLPHGRFLGMKKDNAVCDNSAKMGDLGVGEGPTCTFELVFSED